MASWYTTEERARLGAQSLQLGTSRERGVCGPKWPAAAAFCFSPSEINRMIAETSTAPESLLSVNGIALMLKARGIKPNTRYSVLAAIARKVLPISGTSQWGVLVRRDAAEQYAEMLQAKKHNGVVTDA
jgi:hypothetical protein